MVCWPTVRAEVEYPAVPVPFKETVAAGVPSTLKTMDPVGTVLALPVAVTDAVKVTDSPYVCEFALEIRVVAEAVPGLSASLATNALTLPFPSWPPRFVG